MYRIVKLSGIYKALEIDSLYDDIENIQAFLNESEPVILVNDLEELDHFNITKNEVEIIE